MNSKRGFTLIELLVVIVIIGIVTTIVLAMLGSGRNKARATSAQTSMNQMKSQAEITGTDSQGRYLDTICGVSSINNGAPVLGSALFNLHTAVMGIGGTSPRCYCATSVGGVLLCGGTDPPLVSPDRWAYSAILVDATTFCVDSSGAAKAGTAQTSGLCS